MPSNEGSQDGSSTGQPGQNAWKRPLSMDLWAADVPLYRMWFEFLSCSPSYSKAKRYMAGTLTSEEVAKLPKDFDAVLKCYDNLGDTAGVTFRDWWNERAMAYFGVRSSRPQVRYVGPTHTSSEELTSDDHLRRELAYDEFGWAMQTSQLLMFSTALKRKDVLRRIRSEINKLEFEQKPSAELKPVYPLGKIGKMKPALVKYLRVLKNRAYFPDDELWSIGVRSELNHDAEIWPKDDDIPRKVGEKYCQVMAVATSRALFRARMLCENAARGNFPSHAKLETAEEKFDLMLLAEQVRDIDMMYQREVQEDSQTAIELEKLMIKYGVK